MLIIFAGEVTVYLHTLRSKKLNTFRQSALQKLMIFSVAAFNLFYLLIIFTLKRLYQQTISMVKQSFFVSIYLLAFIMYCNLFLGEQLPVFAKITRVVFTGKHDFLRTQTNQPVFISGDQRDGIKKQSSGYRTTFVHFDS